MFQVRLLFFWVAFLSSPPDRAIPFWGLRFTTASFFTMNHRHTDTFNRYSATEFSASELRTRDSMFNFGAINVLLCCW
jgi:hypothetical protein